MEAEILLYIQDHLRFEALNPVMTSITKLGDAGIFWILLTLILLLFKRTRKIGIAAVCSLILQALIIFVLKNAVMRVRPYDAIEGLIPLVKKLSDFSFPSGHSGASFAVAVVCLKKLPKKYGIPLLVLACLIALSRMYVGVHYPTDVLVGTLIGIITALVSVYFTDKYLLNGKK